LIIYVCICSACHLKGSYNIINKLRKMIEERQLGDKVELKVSLYMGKCTEAVSIRINEGDVISVCEDDIEEFFDKYVIEKLNMNLQYSRDIL